MKRVLVTGANGFVGKHVVRELAVNGFSVIGVGGPEGPKRPEYVDDYHVLDLANAAAAKKINFKGIDAVLHLAGLAAVGASFNEPMRYITVNIGIETNLFEASLAQHAQPRFIIISSGSLYSPTAPLPLTEEALVLANSPYAVSKIGQEYMGHYYASRSFECVIARPFNHIGPGQSRGFIVPDLAHQIVAVERRQSREILVGNLETQRDYTDVRDIARAYRLLIEKGKDGEVYNICSGVAVSGQDILDELIKISGWPIKVKQDTKRIRPTDIPILYGSNQKIVKHTTWRPQIDIKDTLKDVLNDWRQHR